MSYRQPKVSVILCTYNPRRDLLAWALSSVLRQSLPAEEFELVVVDNNSDPPVTPDLIEQHSNGRIVREPRQGLTYARTAGIRATTAPLIVFIDDDNYIDSDYLEQALKIAEEQPWIGCFGGKSRAVLEAAIPAWKNCLLGYLGVRDYGPNAITSTKDCWGEWEPIGAGMVCRRDIAERFAEWVAVLPNAAKLGRNGRRLMSGEDTLIAQASYQCNYSCSYQPALKLSHWIKAPRLSCLVLARTITGHGRSHVILLSLRGQTVPRPKLQSTIAELLRRYRDRVLKDGLEIGTFLWFWDLGYFHQARRMG
jgi:glycosyltransferase involved in cell wall biosynthesis